jgi:predicted RNase H-like nuclease (RuvC/YqgF family)
MLNDNPASISNNSKNDLIKSLQLENDKLKSMINLPNTQAETYQLPNETFIVLQKELQNSKSEIEQLTLRLKRLKDVLLY